jgi:hypothetical protein
VPTLPNVVFSYFNEDLDYSINWSPYLDFLLGIRNRLIKAVRWLPRRYLTPLINGELFESLQAAEDRVIGYSLAAGF